MFTKDWQTEPDNQGWRNSSACWSPYGRLGVVGRCHAAAEFVSEEEEW
jgi:hypothetical protein